MLFRLLGPVEVGGEGEPVKLGPRPAKVVAALLLDANRVVPLARLIDVLWDEDPPAGAAKLARNCVWLVRSALDRAGLPAVIETSGGGYRLVAAADEVDAAVFRAKVRLAEELLSGSAGRLSATERAAGALREALELWRGPALTGIASRELEPAAAHLDEQRLTAAERHAEVELALGRHRQLIGPLTELTRQHPLREQLARHLMVALHRDGRPADALAEYQRLRSDLASEVGLDPGPALRELQQRILCADGALSEPAAVPPARPAPVPRQLPVVGAFTGRARELSELDRMVGDLDSAATVVVSAVSGMGGVGKTSLAVRWGDLARSRFPDGELYVDLQGHHPDSRPLPPADVLARFLRALGLRTGQVPDTLPERAALYRTMMSGRRMLVLLDNAGSADQVRPLLPAAATCAVIVTARSRLPGLVARDGARRIVLDVLSAADALQLLRRAIGAERTAAEPGATAALADQCGYLPLALQIAAERIAADPRTTIAAAVADLADRRTRLDLLGTDEDDASAVRPVLGWSYDRLAAPAREMFVLLGLPDTAEIALPAAAALAGIGTAQAAARLAALSEAHLLDEVAPGRYRMHDLLRLLAAEYAAAQRDEGERRAALGRLLGWYLHSAVAARVALDPQLPPMRPAAADPAVPPAAFADHAQALRWCETEQANLVAASRTAAALGLDEVAWQLPTAMYGYFDLRKQYDAWIDTHRDAVAAARRLGDREAEGRILCNLGNAYRPLFRLEEATGCYRQALELFRAVGYHQGQGKVLGNLASTYQELGRYPAAIEAAEQAIAIFRRLADRYGEALTLTNLGRTLTCADRDAEAAEHHHRALDLFGALGDLPGQARALGNLGASLTRLGRPAEALGLIRRAHEIFAAAGDRYEAANELADLGTAHRALGHHEEADRCLDRALGYFEEVGDEHQVRRIGQLRERH